MKLVQINPDVHVKCQKDWMPLDMWLREKISWIEKDENDIPLAYRDRFYCSLVKKLGDTCFKDLFSKDIIDDNGKETTIWRLKNHEENKQLVFNILKEHGYYELSIWRMIKHIADRQGAHMQKSNSIWIKAANQGKDVGYSAISVFATQMIYAATKQIKELSDYYVTEPIMETL